MGDPDIPGLRAILAELDRSERFVDLELPQWGDRANGWMACVAIELPTNHDQTNCSTIFQGLEDDVSTLNISSDFEKSARLGRHAQVLHLDNLMSG
jgi:hypothetical protein